MRKAVLLGNPDTKRTVYLKKAAEQSGLPLLFVDWKRWEELPEGELFVKIDPPLWESASLWDLESLTEDYRRKLEALSHMSRERSGEISFLNRPSAIELLLDKRRCKKELEQKGLPVTQQLEGPVNDMEGLLEEMRRERIFQVFIKPVRGSGAAGVSAFRIQPKTGRMALCTCALLCKDEHGREGFVNTKRLRRFTDRKEISALLDQLLSMDCIVERWYAKAESGKFSYDLRAVVQEGRADVVLARLSEGPVTNLHLNNHPLSFEELGLPGQVSEELEELCIRAMECFSGLGSAGIDILLEKGSLRPRIIEMNAQGDLIYQDIYGENRIYRHQAEMMKAWLTS